MKKTLAAFLFGLGLVIFAIFVYAGIGILGIWSLNTLAGTEVPYDVYHILAVVVLAGIVSIVTGDFIELKN